MATKYDPATADPGQIEKIPAGQIVIDPNVRKDIRRDPSFVSSIRVLGFQQYPVGYRDGDHVHITVGQRRISAALEIGWDVVPIVIKPRRDAEADRIEELRLIEQIAENEQRAPLTPAELAAGYKRLALLGVTEDQIARKTNAPKTTVQTALAVAASDVATAALEARPITLEQAALLVEFEGDPAAIEAITETLAERPEQVEHTAARIRKDREIAAAVDAKVAELEHAGWVVRREESNYGWQAPAGTYTLRHLYRAGDPNEEQLLPEDVADLEQRHAVVYPAAYRDELVDARYYIGNPTEQGLEILDYAKPAAKGELTDEEKEARRQKRADKADMITATEVRRAWIRDFLTQKNATKILTAPGMPRWIAHAVFQTADCLGHNQRDGNARDLAWELLGLDIPSTKYAYQSRNASAQFINDHPNLALALTAAYAIALAEDVLGDPKHYWAGTQPAELVPYLEQLAEWGYTLSDVEQRLIDSRRDAFAMARAKDLAA